MFLFEEATVERVSSGIIEKLEAVEDLNGAASLNADDASENPRRSGGSSGGGGGIGAVGGGVGRGRLGLGLDPGVVIRNVEYN